jgi:hypothetical protein
MRPRRRLDDGASTTGLLRGGSRQASSAGGSETRPYGKNFAKGEMRSQRDADDTLALGGAINRRLGYATEAFFARTTSGRAGR